MQVLIHSNFDEFSKIFTGDDDGRMKQISNFDLEAREIVTYSLVKILDSYIRNRIFFRERKMVALTYMRNIYAN